MSSTKLIVEAIRHYQHSISNSQDDEVKILWCVEQLYNLPIKVEHLQLTDVGKIVNSLRKYKGDVGLASKTLVMKWKTMMVATEKELMGFTSENESESEKDNDKETHHRNN
uniref:TFIIS N-terminal domain-containing protein n=1 Tax=Glossina brevipalpis TaxID=37001 RepID=A0A1A9WVF4_9MUSC